MAKKKPRKQTAKQRHKWAGREMAKQKRADHEQRKLAELKAMIRQATRSGATEAIEHCHNFWQVGDGYKRYIKYEIEAAAQALMATVTIALRKELDRKRGNRSRKGVGHKRSGVG